MGRVTALLAAVLSLGVGSPQSERLDLGGGVAMEIVKIPAGAFEMGSPAGEAGRGPDEELHRVTIAEDFWLGRTPVTRGQFARFVQETRYKTEAETGTSGGFGWDGAALVQRKDFNWRNPGFPQTDDHPVVIVTYDDAVAFTRWLAKKTGRRVSLPTEAQWEYACRAGTASRFYAGDGDSDAEAIAWFRKNAGNGTRPVGEKTANKFGLSDMSGNVSQWCSDLYAAYVPGGGEQGPMDKPRRVLRGGSWLKDARHVRSAARARNTPGSRNADNGFRVVVGEKPAVPPPAPTPAAPVEKPPPPRDTPPPPPDPEPTTPPIPVESYTPPSRSGDSGFIPVGCLLFVLLAVAMIGFIVWMIRRGSASRPTVAPRPVFRGPPPRIADDGFWFDTTGYTAGDVVTYTYTGRNGTVTEQFLVDPGSNQQFVYTGTRPRDIVLGAMIANQMSQQPPPPPPVSRPSTWTSRTDPPDRPRRHPPAY